ncbi:MAG: helix-turn-helix domain-containing protein [Polyangiales bacterium]
MADAFSPFAGAFLTASEVARSLGVSRTTAYRLMREMGRVRVGRVVRVSRTSFEAWVESHTEERSRPRRRPPEDLHQLGLFGGKR